MNDCDHFLGMSRTIALLDETATTSVHVRLVRASELPLFWPGPTFNFCPTCGADVKDIVADRMTIKKFDTSPTNR